jgi:cysteinyl-tRNA synthetase
MPVCNADPMTTPAKADPPGPPDSGVRAPYAGAPPVLYDSRRRQSVPFTPLDGTTARMYSCGPTVYSRAHLGNMRAYVFADTVRRLLLWKGWPVRHVINITDVGHLLADADLGDDKVEEAARREQRTVWDLTAHYTDLFKQDFARLGCLAPEAWTVATDYVERMITFAERLVEGGHAYALPSGLYFDTSSIDGYGAMATMAHDFGDTEARIDTVEGKHHPADFALWRTFAPDEPAHAMEWESPWGRGAPGWHLECSVMSIETLGEHFDIHTGGVDHREIHHPNEDAQSRAFLDDGEPWVEWWMHVEFLQFGGEKMAKSKGNVLSLDDVIAAGADPMAFRLLLMESHYSSQALGTIEQITARDTRLDRLVDAVRSRLGDRPEPDPDRPLLTAPDALARWPKLDALARMDAAASDNLGTPAVLATVNDAVKDDALGADELVAVLEAARTLLGIDLLARAAAPPPEAAVDDDLRDLIETRIAERLAARAAKDFATADRIRDALLTKHGVTLADGPDGTTWSLAR